MANSIAALLSDKNPDKNLFKRIFERHQAVMLLIDAENGEILDANQAAEAFYGYPRTQLRNMKIDDINALTTEQIHQERENAGKEHRNYFIFPHRLASGYIKTVEVHSSPVEVGGRTVLFSVIHDITDRVEMEKQLKKRELQYRTILEGAADAVFVTNATGWFIYANSKAIELLGYRKETLLQKHITDVVPPHQEKTAIDVFRKKVLLKGQFTTTMTLSKQNGGAVEVELNAIRLPDGNVYGSCRDITTKKQEEKARRSQDAQLKAIFEQAAVGVALIDTHTGHFLKVNRKYCDISGRPRHGIRRMTPQDMIHPDDRQTYLLRIESLKTGESREISMEKRIINGEGQTVWVNMSISPLWKAGEKPTYHIAVVEDITARKRTEARLDFLAHHDILTGLPNRTLMDQRLKHAIDHADRHGEKLAVLFIDLDRFKNVNDSLGHPAGDELLVCIAQRIKNRLRDEDTLVRLGGDEFIILIEGFTRENGPAVLAKSLIEVINAPFVLSSGYEVFVGCSIGISYYPDDAHSPTTLIQHADAALFQAKHTGRNTYHFYTASLTRAANERLELEAQLRRALVRNEFEVHYQPLLNVNSNEIIGAEALVRWNHPQFGRVSPGKFIPLAEETGLIKQIGEWVLRTACEQVKDWFGKAGAGTFKLAINLSARQLHQPGLDVQLRNTLEAIGFPAGNLELEITESAIMEYGEDAPNLLRRLKKLGISLAVDDFGTGYSSLAYLKQFAVDKLKIDRSFIRDIPDDQNDVELTATIINMGHNLKLTVLAEGVETPEQLDFLKKQGCHYYQGFFYSKPIPSHEFLQLLKKQGR